MATSRARPERKPTTPEEEGIELYPDAMERTERAIKAAFRTGHVSKEAVKKMAAEKRRKHPVSIVHKGET
jgi:hypothetical protein